MASTIVEGFSLSHAAILNGTTGAEEVDGDIYTINSGSLELQTDSFDNTGDDTVRSTWTWFDSATVTIQAGYIPFKTIALLSGTTVTSSGTAPNDYYTLPLWSAKSLVTAPRPMLLRIPSKDENGVPRTLDIVLFKVQFSPFSFDGPSYKAGLKLNYTGRALVSNFDEKGVALSDPAIGRLVSRPQI